MIQTKIYMPEQISDDLHIKHGAAFYPEATATPYVRRGKLINWKYNDSSYMLEHFFINDLLDPWYMHGISMESSQIFRLQEDISELLRHMQTTENIMRERREANINTDSTVYKLCSEVFSIEHKIRVFKIYQNVDYERTDIPEEWIKVEHNAIDAMLSKQAERDNLPPESYYLELYKKDSDYLYYVNYVDYEHKSEDLLVLTLIAELDEYLSSVLTEVETEFYDMIKKICQFKNPTAHKRMQEGVFKLINQKYILDISRQVAKHDLEQNLKTTLKSNETRRLNEITRTIERLEQQLQVQYSNRQYLMKDIAFSDKTLNQEDLDYVFNSSYVRSVKRIDTAACAVYIDIAAPMDYLNIEEVELFCNRTQDMFPKLSKLLKDLYLEGNGYIYAATLFQADFANGNVRMVADDTANVRIRSGINPHHFFYQCLGNYASPITDAIKNLNLPILTDLLIATTRNLNIADSAVMTRYEEYLNIGKAQSKIWINYKGEDITLADYYNLKRGIDVEEE